ncbi:PLAC8-domain-containing protein [Dacryopinax primogenitus]|uniref:PLAC8-domain-containing protein n=1 Tax=Dacryopinax primogenitus (strain DJM 731) TaxID=1858805 RepID=M5FQN8_DACPD|nr:PLAC8-domain-containing protein [Dacryopinax primogenitus]EJT99230.1 PLAC8-domain-containing protein [Dacryopinax primogenitus]
MEKSSVPPMQAPMYQQPVATPGMMMQPGGMRNSRNKPSDKGGKRDWNHGLCDCFGECGTCCQSFWCPCITYGRNKSRLNALQEGHVHPTGGDGCGSDCMVYCLVSVFTGLSCIMEIMNRGSIRQRYFISGNGCTDCMGAWCCHACVMTQESRELEDEERALQGGL